MLPKLRLYDKRGKRFLMPLTEGPYDDIDLVYADGKWYIHGGHEATEEDYRIDLFIGAYDKEGNELYEYDIVKVPAHYEGDAWITEYNGVIYNNEGEYIITGNGKTCSLFDCFANYNGKVIGKTHDIIEEPGIHYDI